MIAREVTATVKELVTKKIAARVEGRMDKILHKRFYNDQRDVRSIEFNFVKLFMLDQLREQVIEETLDPHIASFSPGMKGWRIDKEAVDLKLFYGSYRKFC